MSVVSAVLLFLVLFERCQSSFAVKHVAKNQESFQDIQINNVKNKLITTRVECILECVTMVTCMSVLYHTTTRTCYRLSIGYTTSPTDVGFHDIGWRYYIILEGMLCNVHWVLNIKGFFSDNLLVRSLPNLGCFTIY